MGIMILMILLGRYFNPKSGERLIDS